MSTSVVATRLEELTRECRRLMAELAALRTMELAEGSVAPALPPPPVLPGLADGGRVPPLTTVVASGEGQVALTVEGVDGATGLRVRTDRGPGVRIESAEGGMQIASGAGPAVYAEAMDAAAVVASSVGGHGIHAIGGGVSGGMSSSARPCGVFAEGGSGDGLYAIGAEVAVHAVSTAGYGASLSGERAPLHLVPASTLGPPASGAYLPGALFVDATVTLWLCTEAGTPGTWQRVVTRSVRRPPFDSATSLPNYIDSVREEQHGNS